MIHWRSASNLSPTSRVLFFCAGLQTPPFQAPPELVKAHAELDHAVEKCYRPEPFHSDHERVEYLFSVYEKLTAPLAIRHAQNERPAVTDRRYKNAGQTEGTRLVFARIARSVMF